MLSRPAIPVSQQLVRALADPDPGVKIWLSEWGGIERKRIFRLSGTAEFERGEEPAEAQVTDIDPAVIDALQKSGAGHWHVPSRTEYDAESEYAIERERQQEEEDRSWRKENLGTDE